MTLPVWPASLPNPAEYSFAPQERRRVQPVATDPPGFRGFAREALVTATVRWRMTPAQAAVFDPFWRTDLAYATRWFTVRLPGRGGMVARSARFTAPPQRQHLSVGIVDVTGQMEVR